MENENILLPEEAGEMTIAGVSKLREIEQQLRQLFEKKDIQEVMPPNFEYASLYTRLDAGFEQEKMFQFINHEGAPIALRYDFTVPLARKFALSGEKTARYSYFGKVFRKEKRHKGRRTESYQIGTELLGTSEIEGDNEILALTFASLQELSLKNTILGIGSAAFYKRLCEMVGDEAGWLTDILSKKDLTAMDSFAKEGNFREGFQNLLLALPTVTDVETLDRLVWLAGDKILVGAFTQLSTLYKNLPTQENVIFDLGMVPAMGYYTGLMFQVYAEGAAQPIISGGRYDELIKKFGAKTGAVGFCVHMDNVLKGLDND
ncbi:ATP phosphoribosyltransferase regulatory subunit [Lactococcus nasutitermitis]|uniref:ATP phosphoribosyltransferase regulatory subunit n=1 Tax=Lactococcus nasutitermitis TaxID=1652957 RepID=A0ABV9JEG0_9LACT|nr:ATP phosphoribosyltransferase regulatory subunit [Lactococcus nasutitermitis]